MARRRSFEHPWRVVIVVVGLLIVLNLGVFLLASSDTSSTQRSLPSEIESVTPESGSVRPLQDAVSVDLRDGLTGVLLISGVEIPEDQLERGEALGIVTFRPGPDREFTRWSAGDVAVQVLYWPATDERPATPDSYSWSFRAAA